MQKELIDKANEIIGLIEKNERSAEELDKCLTQEAKIHIGRYGVGVGACGETVFISPKK